MVRDWLHTTTCSYSLSIINYDYDYYHLPLGWPPHHSRAHTQFYYQNYIRPKTEYYVMMISYRLTVLCFVLLVPTADWCGRFVPTLWLLQLWSPEESFCYARGASVPDTIWNILLYDKSIFLRYVRCLSTLIQYNMIFFCGMPAVSWGTRHIIVPVPIQAVLKTIPAILLHGMNRLISYQCELMKNSIRHSAESNNSIVAIIIVSW